MKQKFIDLYMDWAKRLSELSHAQRLKVGAVIVKDDCVISYGYNGMPAGWDNNCEHKEWMSSDAGGWLSPEEIYERWPFEEFTEVQSVVRYKLVTNQEVLHAESNAISKLARSHNSGSGADIFITHSPCLECAKLIYQSGISGVYYGQDYRDSSGINFLLRSGISVKKIGE
jgi:dCMP deaminase